MFKKEFLQEIIYEAVEDNITDTSRWSEHHEAVFKFDEKFYMTYYSCGLTESQDESPYEYEKEDIECFEVEQKEVIVKKFMPVD
jgi:hypothetical protein